MEIRSAAQLSHIDNTVLFILYAGSDPRYWNKLVGYPVEHNKYGQGKVIGISTDIILVSFDDLSGDEKERKFTIDAFENGFFTIPGCTLEQIPNWNDVHDNLCSQIESEREIIQKEQEERIRREEENKQQLEKEAADTKRFAKLKSSFRATAYKDRSPASPLYVILLKIDEGNTLAENEIEWLSSNHLYETSALYYEKLFSHHSDPWIIVRAGKFWRMAKRPERAIEISQDFKSNDQKLNTAIQTNRGGAFRDLGRLSDALECAEKAIEFSPDSFYAYNLLGAVHYQLGDPEEGDRSFKRAIELGALPRVMEEEIKKSVKAAGKEEREQAAQYLLNKDPKKYGWARHYLK